jgi:RNA-binding protein 39
MGDGDYKDEWDELEKKLDAPSADAPADDEDPKKPGEKRDRRDRDRDVRRDRGDRSDRDRGDRGRGGRDRDRSRDRGGGARDRDRDRGRDRRHSRRSRSRSRSKGGSKLTDEEREAEKKRRREERESEQQKRELEKLDRDTRTVFAYNLSTKADEREIYKFFSAAGIVSDVRIIYDRNTPRSKGMAYVEFKDKASIENALSLTGQTLRNQVVMVKSSEAEKNIAWEAEQATKREEQKLATTVDPAINPNLNPTAGPCKLRVEGVHPNVREEDLKAVFEPFGETDFITIDKDQSGGAHVQYKLTQQAMLAVSQLNGLELVGKTLKVFVAPVVVNPATAAAIAYTQANAVSLSEDAEGVRMDSRGRAALMARLAGTSDGGDFAGVDASGRVITAQEAAKMATPQMPAAALPTAQGVLGPGSPIPTQTLLLKNLFDPKEETEPEWWNDIAEDVKDECGKHGAVAHCHVDKDSEGFVYLKFAEVKGAERAQAALHSRWFAGRMIAAEYQFTAVYNKHFGL